MAIEGEGSCERVALELLHAAQASVNLVERYLDSGVPLSRHGYWHRRGVPTLPHVRASIHSLRDRSGSPGVMEQSAKRMRRPEEGEEFGEGVVEAVELVCAAKANVQAVERYLDRRVPMCRHKLVTRRSPIGMRDNGEFLTECARCGKLL
jgi:hypothetical protein